MPRMSKVDPYAAFRRDACAGLSNRVLQALGSRFPRGDDGVGTGVAGAEQPETGSPVQPPTGGER